MITQQIFIIPPEIEAGLISGDLVQWGGIVRNLSGQIVKHLKEVMPEAAGQSKAARAGFSRVSWSGLAGSIKEPWVIIPAAVAATVAGGAAVYVAARKYHKAGKVEMPTVVASYNASLRTYLEAVRDGRLTEAIIETLASDLDAVIAYGDEGGTISLDFSAEHAKTLAGIVVDSTQQLVEANDLDLDELQDQVPTNEGHNVVDLRRYLEIQKRIFRDAG